MCSFTFISAVQALWFIHSLICWPLSRTAGSVRALCFAQGHLSSDNEGGTSASLSFPFPDVIPLGFGIELMNQTSAALAFLSMMVSLDIMAHVLPAVRYYLCILLQRNGRKRI